MRYAETIHEMERRIDMIVVPWSELVTERLKISDEFLERHDVTIRDRLLEAADELQRRGGDPTHGTFVNAEFRAINRFTLPPACCSWARRPRNSNARWIGCRLLAPSLGGTPQASSRSQCSIS
jgi:hypothetical protein